MAVLTPNMSLIQPVIGTDTGLTWEQAANANSQTVDQHNHSPGQGVPINQTGFVLTGDFSFLNFNATALRSSRYTPQTAPLAGATDLGCLYVSGVDLWFNDVSGNQVQMTSGGAVLATSSGISSGTATASFSSGVLVVLAASLTPANIKGGSLLLGNNIASSKYLTLSPPSAMAANYGLTLPAIPVSTKFLTLDTSGNIATASSISASQIANDSLVYAQIAGAVKAPTVQKFTSGTGTYTTPSSPAPLYIRVRMVGGGGGGAGGSQSGGNGGNGGNTTFGTSFLVANGGSGSIAASNNGLAGAGGGAASLPAGATGITIAGSAGINGGTQTGTGAGAPLSSFFFPGGAGGSSAFGGAGLGAAGAATATPGATNSGSGGGGGGQNGSNAAANVAAGGGGSGNFVDAIITSLASTYSYAIGAGGTAGTSGGGEAGAAGGSGVVIVEEFYQ